MRVDLKGTPNQKIMASPKMRRSHQEINDFIDGIQTMPDVKAALADVMKQIAALRHNIKRNRR